MPMASLFRNAVPKFRGHVQKEHGGWSRSLSTRSKTKTCYIAFGSNIGNRLNNIEDACRRIDLLEDTKITRTSRLWETEPMYVRDQDTFLNGICEIKTQLEPLDLLDALQSIEVDLKRKKVIDKGPRTIDLDILLYEDLQYHDERLTIPHPLMHERTFVLLPLCEYVFLRPKSR
jgi:2-amino-4-hydroxy-6-hydroxymethyldihydropteridine diphosphokinase/dihydropteroate synthase